MLNNVTLIGILGKKPELKSSSSGSSFCNFSLATSMTWSQGGEKKQETEWHNIVAFGKLADTISKFCDKGHTICIEGRIKTEKYTKDGEDRYSTKIMAEKMTFITKPKGAPALADDLPHKKEDPQPKNLDDIDYDNIPF
jgi:single-strand DNA-binding protein